MKLYLFTDVETTGLNFRKDGSVNTNPMLQIAYKLYDSTIENELASGNFYVEYTDVQLQEFNKYMNDYVREMHTSTGLLDKVFNHKDTTPLWKIDEVLSEQLSEYKDERIIIAGNNVHFDFEVVRRHLPKTSQHLNYSVLDVSVIRHAFETIGSDFGKRVKESKLSNHDALVDIDECVKEFKVYQEVLRQGVSHVG